MAGKFLIGYTLMGILWTGVGAALLADARATYRVSKRLAEQLGFEPSTFPFSRLRATRRGFDIEISFDKNGVTVSIRNVSPGFTLLNGDSELVRRTTPGIRTGDREFDDPILVNGDAVLARAVLGHEARGLALSVIKPFGGVQQGRLWIRLRADIVPAWLPTLLDLAEALRRPESHEVPGLLAQRALSDRSAGVRRQAFEELRSSFADSAELRRCAEDLLGSPDLTLRLEAAHWLLQTPAGEKPEIHEAAVQALHGLLGERTGDDPVGDEIFARGVAQFGDVSMQPRLLAMLEHPAHGVRVEAVRALGAVGDVRAVESLRALKNSGVLQGLRISRDVDQAVTDIQSRLGGSQAGELSLAAVSPLDGAVSPIEDDEDAAGPAGGEVPRVEDDEAGKPG